MDRTLVFCCCQQISDILFYFTAYFSPTLASLFDRLIWISFSKISLRIRSHFLFLEMSIITCTLQVRDVLIWMNERCHDSWIIMFHLFRLCQSVDWFSNQIIHNKSITLWRRDPDFVTPLVKSFLNKRRKLRRRGKCKSIVSCNIIVSLRSFHHAFVTVCFYLNSAFNHVFIPMLHTFVMCQ